MPTITITRDNLLPPWARQALESVPAAGEGVNRHLIRMAHALKHACTPEEAYAYIAKYTADCGRTVRPQEIRRAINRAFNTQWDGSVPIDSYKVQANLEAINEIACRAGKDALFDLWLDSPAGVKEDEHAAETVIDALYPGNPLLCVATEDWNAWTLRRSELRGRLHRFAKMVPSPMSAETGLNQEGKESPRTLNNTGPRTYLVIECDFSEYARDGKTETKYAPLIREWRNIGLSAKDVSAAIVRELSKHLPLACVVDSAGKSLHSFFHSLQVADTWMLQFMRYATSLGADPATWTKCQLVRLPGGTRVELGKHQSVIYFNPNAVRKQ